jgi:YHS domain-containing protein
MPDKTRCEQCGGVISTDKAERIVADDQVTYFCSERCKLEWSERPELDEEP